MPQLISDVCCMQSKRGCGGLYALGLALLDHGNGAQQTMQIGKGPAIASFHVFQLFCEQHLQ